jgi:hypothetical protein
VDADVVDVDVADVPEAWPCAAISALIVAGEICVNPAPPVTGGGLPVCAWLLVVSNGVVALWVKPVVCGEVDFDEVSDCSASIADEAAPRASSMTELRQMPRSRGLSFYSIRISKRRAISKNPVK